jgi:hypothetical protein
VAEASVTKHGHETSHADAARFLELLARPGDVFELRGLQKGRSVPQVTAGYFNDMQQLAAAAIDRSGKDDGVYITLNPCNPALLARAPANRVRQAGNGDTTSDRDVQHRRHLLVDVDPVRPTGISSTDDEHAEALTLAATIADALTAMGWPEPIRADSGNGGHLIYGIDLPVDDGGLVKRVLAGLSQRFSSKTLKVDEKVFNPARISKMYGTLTKKGENTAERPHRLSRILSAPAHLEVVSREQLEALTPSTAPPPVREQRPRDPQRSRSTSTHGSPSTCPTRSRSRGARAQVAVAGLPVQQRPQPQRGVRHREARRDDRRRLPARELLQDVA